MSKYSVKTTFEAINKVTAPVRKMAGSVNKFTISAENGLRKVDSAIGGISKSLMNGATSVAKWGAGTAAAAAVGIGLINQQQQEVVNLTNAVGGNIQTVEAISSALANTGLGVDNVIDLYEEMNNKLGESAGLEEITAVSESLAILGLRFEGIKKLSPEDQFKTITNAALKMEDATKAQAAADILLGGEANKVIGTLRQQGKSIEDIIGNYEQLSFRTEQSRAGATRMAQAQTKAGQIFKSLGQEVSGLAGKHFGPMIEKLNEFLIANKEIIGQSIDKFFNQISESVGDVSTIFDRALNVLKNLHANFESVKEWAATIAKVTAVVVTLMATLNIFIGVMTAVNLVMAANPATLVIMGIVAAVTALAAAAYAIYDNWDSIVKFFMDAWSSIKTALGFDPVEIVASVWSGLTDFFGGLFGSISAMYENTVGKVMSGIQSAKNFLGFGDDEESTPAPAPPKQMSRQQQRIENQFRERMDENKRLAVMSPEERQAYFNQKMTGTLDVNVYGNGGVTPEQPTYQAQLKLATSGN